MAHIESTIYPQVETDPGRQIVLPSKEGMFDFAQYLNLFFRYSNAQISVQARSWLSLANLPGRPTLDADDLAILSIKNRTPVNISGTFLSTALILDEKSIIEDVAIQVTNPKILKRDGKRQTLNDGHPIALPIKRMATNPLFFAPAYLAADEDELGPKIYIKDYRVGSRL